MSGGQVLMSGGIVNGAVVSQGGDLRIYAGAEATDAVVSSGGKLMIFADGAVAAPVISSGGTLTVAANGSVDNTVLKICAKMTVANGAKTGDKLTLDFSGASSSEDMMMVDYINRLSENTSVCLTGIHRGAYYLGSNGTLGREVYVNNGLYDFAVPADLGGEGVFVADAANLLKYSFNGVRRFAAESLEVTSGAAVALTANDTYEGGGTNRAALWTDDADADVVAVDENFTGDAYVVIAGAHLAKALYGADTNFDGTININAESGTIRNLAAGAKAGSHVGAVNLTFDGATLAGVGYAGGFGTVTNDVTTLVIDGRFSKDFYAGALANKNAELTFTGDTSLTIKGGIFSGNVYGASAVKTSTSVGNGLRHMTDNVTVTLAGGSTTKYGFSVFAGGYATGDATGTVYKVDGVEVAVTGGDWGTAAGGRGIFGGVMADGVTAEVVEDVNISISGGTMGNVFGGGWAQRGGTSIVGAVSITISGGSVANVFGGGSHSTSGGTTVAASAAITVSGGDITVAIYAMGQLDGDSVTGGSTVTFTGRNDYGCAICGYGSVESPTPTTAKLVFANYSGELSGKIGGFADVQLSGDTVAVFTGEIEDDITSWDLDLTGRAVSYRGDGLAKLDEFADATTVKVTFADAEQAQGGWNIARVGDVNGANFDLTIGTEEIVSGLAYDTQIGSGDYAEWGFRLDDGILKFQKLA